MAAAIGVGLSVHEPKGHMVVDIGGGTTEIAVIALAGVIHAQSVRLAGDKLTEDIMHYFRRTQNLLIGYKTAEKIKCEIGSAAPLDEELEMDIKGRDLVRGIPKTLRVSSVEVRSAISQTLNLIVESILGSLEETPPELAGDILDHGIMLAGGGALLKNLDRRIAERIDLPVHIAEDPMTAVVRGTGAVLDDLEYYKAVLV
jgi:rod shape-determining protein MreB and related proteins